MRQERKTMTDDCDLVKQDLQDSTANGRQRRAWPRFLGSNQEVDFSGVGGSTEVLKSGSCAW